MTGRQCQRHEHQATPQSVVAIHHYPKHVISAKDLGKRIIRQSGNFNATTYLRQRLSAAIQCGNALSVIGTCNSLPLCLFSFWFFSVCWLCVFTLVFACFLSFALFSLHLSVISNLSVYFVVIEHTCKIMKIKIFTTHDGSTTHKFSQSQ